MLGLYYTTAVVSCTNVQVADLEAALKEKEASEVELKQNVTHLTDTLQRTVSWCSSGTSNSVESVVANAHTCPRASTIVWLYTCMHTHTDMYMGAHHLLTHVSCCVLLQSESLVSLQSKVESKIREVATELDDTKSLLAQVRQGWERCEGKGGEGRGGEGRGEREVEVKWVQTVMCMYNVVLACESS